MSQIKQIITFKTLASTSKDIACGDVNQPFLLPTIKNNDGKDGQHMEPNVVLEAITLTEWRDIVEMRTSVRPKIVKDFIDHVLLDTYFGNIRCFLSDIQCKVKNQDYALTIKLICDFKLAATYSLETINTLNKQLETGVLLLDSEEIRMQGQIKFDGGVTVLNVVGQLVDFCLAAEKIHANLVHKHTH